MTHTATLTYDAYLGGAAAADIIAAMDAEPLPIEYLDVIGVRVVSDTAAGTNPVVDTVVLSLTPLLAASAVCTRIDKGDSGSGIESVMVALSGTGYTAPPVVTFVGGRPPSIQESVLSGDENTPAYAQAYLKIASVAIVSGGAGYSADSFAVVDGPIQPDGTQGSVTLTIVGGVITGVAVAGAGTGYTGVATVTVVDPHGTGSGADISTAMGVGKIDVLRAGGGYSSAPTVVLTPLFGALFPVASDQAAPFKELMTTAFQQATIGPVSAGAPVIA